MATVKVLFSMQCFIMSTYVVFLIYRDALTNHTADFLAHLCDKIYNFPLLEQPLFISNLSLMLTLSGLQQYRPCHMGTCHLPCVLSRAKFYPTRQKTSQEQQSDHASTVPSPFPGLDAPKGAWIYHKMATSVPFIDRVFRPFPVSSTVPSPCGQCQGRSATVGLIGSHHPVRQSIVLLPCSYRPGAARLSTLRRIHNIPSYTMYWCIDTLDSLTEKSNSVLAKFQFFKG